MVKSYETCSEDELSKIVFRGVEVKKSEIGGGGGGGGEYSLALKEHVTFLLV